MDAPETLHSGAEMIISVAVYIHATAFTESPKTAEGGPSIKAMFDEGHETEEEQKLRQRKAALIKLFRALSLNPIRGAGVVAQHAPPSEVEQAPSAGLQANPEMDDQPIDVDNDDEELSDNELNTIYKR